MLIRKFTGFTGILIPIGVITILRPPHAIAWDTAF
jgi:hypothetical protein